jgi:hypothetical protein
MKKLNAEIGLFTKPSILIKTHSSYNGVVKIMRGADLPPLNLILSDPKIELEMVCPESL